MPPPSHAIDHSRTGSGILLLRDRSSGPGATAPTPRRRAHSQRINGHGTHVAHAIATPRQSAPNQRPPSYAQTGTTGAARENASRAGRGEERRSAQPARSGSSVPLSPSAPRGRSRDRLHMERRAPEGARMRRDRLDLGGGVLHVRRRVVAGALLRLSLRRRVEFRSWPSLTRDPALARLRRWPCDPDEQAEQRHTTVDHHEHQEPQRDARVGREAALREHHGEERLADTHSLRC